MSWRTLSLLALSLSMACLGPTKDDDDDDEDDDGDDSGWDVVDDTGEAGGDDTATTGDDTGVDPDDTGSGGGCETVIEETVPQSGQADAYYRSDIEIMLSNPEGDERLSLSTAGGASVSGSLSHDGETMRFTPDSPLTPSTDYRVEVVTCAGTARYDFTTSAYGTPTDGCDPTADAWVLDLDGARFVEPPGVGPLLSGLLELEVIAGLSRASGSSATLVLGTGESGVQDVCATTTELDGSWSDPRFSIGPADADVAIDGIAVTLEDLAISGDVSPVCSGIAGGEMSFVLDTRVLAPAMGDVVGSDDPDDVCALLASFGVECGICGDGEEYCIDVHIDQLEGTSTGAAIQARSEADILDDSDCDGISGGCASAPPPRRPTPWLPLAMLPGAALVAFRRRS